MPARVRCCGVDAAAPEAKSFNHSEGEKQKRKKNFKKNTFTRFKTGENNIITL